MSKKPSIFKQFKFIYFKNPKVFWAILWVSVMPSIGTLLTLQGIYFYWDFVSFPATFTFPFILAYILICTLLMGFALLPTTFLSVLSGFIFGWKAFLLLVLAYTLASILGYLMGRRLSEESLTDIMQQYPKAAVLIQEKSDKMKTLVFYVRISPVIPFALSNVIFALLKAGLANVVWAGLIGMLPRTLLAFLSGTLAIDLYQAIQSKEENWQLGVLILLFLISIWGIYRFFTKSK